MKTAKAGLNKFASMQHNAPIYDNADLAAPPSPLLDLRLGAEQRGRVRSAHITGGHRSRLPAAVHADTKELDEKSSRAIVDDYTSPMLPPRKLTYLNSRSEFEKRHGSLAIEPNPNYQRMRDSLKNDSVRAVYRNRLHPEDIANDRPATGKAGSATPDPAVVLGGGLFPGAHGN